MIANPGIFMPFFKKEGIILARTKYKKKIKNGYTYFFQRLYHRNSARPIDIYAKSVSELKEKIEQKTFELDRGVTSSRTGFGDYLRTWMEDVCFNDKKESTKIRYRSCYDKYFKKYPIYHTPLKTLSALDIQKHYTLLLKEGASISTIKTIAKIIHPCIRYAYNQGKIPVDFSKSIILPTKPKTAEKQLNASKPNRRSSKALSEAEERKLLSAVSGTRFENLILIALNTGMRRGELLALTWNDVDFKENTISVNKTYNPKIKNEPVDTPKTHCSNRIIPIAPPIIPVLEELKDTYTANKSKYGSKYTDLNLVFSRDNGLYLSTTTIDRDLKKYCENAKIDPVTLHDFRDTFASRLYEKTKDLKMIQTLLGHADYLTTADIYTHVSDKSKQDYIQTVFK